MILIKEVTGFLEGIAPVAYQESYDNAGLITGDPNTPVRGVMVCLDSTEDVVEDAIRNNCNLIIAHHPIIFGGLKKINGKNYIERTVIKAIKNDIAIYAIHTNLDNVFSGVNKMIAEKLGLINLKILSPKNNVLRKLVTFCPVDHAEKLRSALFEAGAGGIGNYSDCSFNIAGEGTFRGNNLSNPVRGKKLVRHTEKEIRMEMIFESHKQRAILKSLFENHPYEEVAYDIYRLENDFNLTGSGIIGELAENQDEMSFLKFVKSRLSTDCVRYTELLGKKIEKVAICGGSGSFMLTDAIKSGAQIFISADFKYHQFFDADKKIVIADIGHFESEQFTMELIKSRIVEKFSTFAVRLTGVGTNPVNYL
jgi:dinuclear metal center YbgI/SA1388 family protein